MKRPKLNALRAFESSARHLNFSSAGEELGISQAAISQQIRQLEIYLDARLFVRHNRGLSLTGLGEAYYLTVHESLDRLDSVTDQLFPRTHERLITIQCSPSVATLWLIPRLAPFRAEHPEIRLRIVTLGGDSSENAQTHVDLEIINPGPGDSKSQSHKLIDVEISPVCSPDLLRHTQLSNPADVVDNELLHVLGYNDDWHRWFRTFGLRSRRVPAGTSFDGSLMALESAINGGGIMLGRRPFIDNYLVSNDLVLPFGEQYVLGTSYYLRNTDLAARKQDREAVQRWLLSSASETSKGK
jgi:LysR family glycine cleavage system transcriptional activator